MSSKSHRRQEIQAELHHGFFWDCDNCGHENFERSVIAEVSKSVLKELNDAYNIVGGECHLVGDYPDSVCCQDCKKTYKAKVYHYES